jgi:EcsC protein family
MVLILGLDQASDGKPWTWLNRLAASASGAGAGFLGAPGLMFDIPVTTGVIIRSIAEIARSHGEDISTLETKRACLEVFA